MLIEYKYLTFHLYSAILLGRNGDAIYGIIVNFSDGFAACGYLYPKKITVFASDPDTKNEHRPLGVWDGKRFDAFANDQNWALYYAIKFLLQ